MSWLFVRIIFLAYFGAALLLLVYGINCYVMIYLSRRRQEHARAERNLVRRRWPETALWAEAPSVTTQIPIYNEYNVTERVLRAVCAMHYPPQRHEIQVLDDSTDDTRWLVDRTVAALRRQGFDIKIIRRGEREGYKAGALDHGMKAACGDFIAIFDADFVPDADFLIQTIPFFLEDPKLGLVQARWGHLNRGHSLLTRAQSIGIDGHFMVEQSARAWNGLLLNFNGTAGVWRKSAIEAGGGWQWDTLTEDMDLSYRMQLAGWKACYLPDVVVPAEIPSDVAAFKSQQFRWAKGSIQTAKKILPAVLRARVPLFCKLQAVFHVTHYLVHPLMLTLAILALPVLLSLEISLAPVPLAFLAAALVVAMLAPTSLYFFSQRMAYGDWRRRVFWLPVLVVIGVGLAVSNTWGVLQAIVGHESPFVRTPKRGDREMKAYGVCFPWSALIELFVGVYCLLSLGVYIGEGKYVVGPFLAVYAFGFLFMGLLTLTHAFAGYRRRSRRGKWRSAGVDEVPLRYRG